MPFQPVEATARVELVQSLSGQNIQNVLYFRQATDYDSTDLATLSAFVLDWWANELSDNLSNQLSLINVTATALHDQAGPQFINTTGLPVTGQVSGDAVPNNCALCVSFRTALIGRAFRGRNFIPGIPEAFVALSVVEATPSAAMVADYALLMTTAPAGMTWVVVTRTVNGVLQSPVGLTNPVQSVQLVDRVIDSQRRRLPGRGT